MRPFPARELLTSIALASLALLAGCGGGTPPPKDSNEAVASTAPQSSGDKSSSTAPAEESAASAAPAPSAASASQAASSPPASSAGAGSPADDVWMAPHQMPPGDVLKTVRPAQAKVQGCFRAGLKRDPSTSGEVKIRFVITNDGAVRDWRDEGSSMTDEEVTKCVGELIKKLKFPKQKSPGDAWGIYTINFSP